MAPSRIIAGAALSALAACSEPAPSHEHSDRPRLVATTPMVADVARAVGGDGVEVVTLVGPGVDPHLFRPTRAAVAEIVAADLVVTNGLHLEGRLGAALGRVEAAGRPVVAAAEAVPGALLIEAEGAADPHVWMDASLWARTATPVAEALARVDPANAEGYRERAAMFARQAEALDAELAAMFATIPEGRRTLVTAHDAFGYLGRRYGLEVVGVQGLSTESEAGLRDLEATVAMLVEGKIPAVFIESTVSPRTVQALVDGARARGHEVRIGGTLYSDSTGPAGSEAGSWAGMLRTNAKTIVEALTKEANHGP